MVSMVAIVWEFVVLHFLSLPRLLYFYEGSNLHFWSNGMLRNICECQVDLFPTQHSIGLNKQNLSLDLPMLLYRQAENVLGWWIANPALEKPFLPPSQNVITTGASLKDWRDMFNSLTVQKKENRRTEEFGHSYCIKLAKEKLVHRHTQPSISPGLSQTSQVCCLKAPHPLPYHPVYQSLVLIVWLLNHKSWRTGVYLTLSFPH